LNSDTIKVNVIREAVGAVTDSDVLLADASNALIVGFHIRPDAGARRAAEERRVEIKYYDIIYNLIEDIQTALSGMAEPVYHEVVEGHVEVRATFKAGRVVIAGCYVTDGTIRRNSEARVLRNGQVVTNGRITSLKRFKEDAREVTMGYECGIVMEGFNDFQEGDIVETYGQQRIA
jgi:translation initiation factor IF-2